MQHEEERVKTFEKWPLSFISPETLARSGFYYLGRGDEVRCAFCKVEIMRWVEGDEPTRDHQKWSPQCPFLRKQVVADNECDVSASASVDMPAHPRYVTEVSRLRTFKDWPRSMKQKPKQLAEAGFYYTGIGDKTKCFYCDGGLKDWEEEDEAWEQHARWFSSCVYVQLVKGQDYVQKVISEAARAVCEKTSKLNDMAVDEVVQVTDSQLCKICYVNERNICFVPCGHVVACGKCALATDKCPLCRQTISSAMRLYFS